MDMGSRGVEGALDSRQAVSAQRALLEECVRTLPDAPPPGRFTDRGVVLCAGGDIYFPCAYVCLALLRRAGCTLPVELWYRGRRELTDDAIALLAELGVTCVDARAVARREAYPRLDTWEIKALAIAHSRFAEVLYLDADNVPLRNPETLFGCEEYRRDGALFWPDRYDGMRGIPWLRREAWTVCGVPFRREPELEAGQLLVDKSRCWPALALTLFLNGNSDYYYRFFYGDKDTFHLAWRRLGLSYAIVPHPPRDLGRSDGMLQHDLDGTPLFEHRCSDKWTLSRPNRSIDGFRAEAECRAVLDTLRERWQPPMRVFPSELTPAERDAYQELSATRTFVYTVDRTKRVVELLPDFIVRDSGAESVGTWMVEEDHRGEMTLTVGPHGAPAILRRDAGGDWHGRAFRTRQRYSVAVSSIPTAGRLSI